MNRESFIFYRSFYEAIKELPLESQGKIYTAICNYVLEGKTTTFKGIEYAIWSLIKPQLDANVRRYENGVKFGHMGAEHGKKGGRPSKQKPSKNPQDNPQKTLVDPFKKPTNVNKNVNDNVNKNVIYTKNYFKEHSEEVLQEAEKEYPLKDCRKVMREFLNGIEAKNYGYKNHKRAYFNWIERSSHTKSGVQDNGSVRADVSKYANVKKTIIRN